MYRSGVFAVCHQTINRPHACTRSMNLIPEFYLR
jgi:hypothetical protein